MSRKRGSNKYSYYLQVAKAGLLWERCWSREDIAHKIGVTTRMVDYYVARWNRESEAILEYIKLQREQASKVEIELKSLSFK